MGCMSFQIFVDSPTGAYYPGSNVTGRVVLVLAKPMKVQGLCIKCEGSASVSLIKYETVGRPPKNGPTDPALIPFVTKEEYFSNKCFLIGSSINEVEIPVGENVFPFSTTLPSRLPASFECDHGYVRYSITAFLDRSWKNNEKAQIYFTVVPYIDLNFLPFTRESVTKEATKTFCCLCCKSGFLTLAGSIPYSGYTPGQTIVVTFEVDNKSKVHIGVVRCKLRKEVKWIVRHPMRNENVRQDSIIEVDLDEVLPNSSKSWIQNISIPQMPVINLDGCSIIRVEYYVEIEASPSSPHRSLKLKFPITFGTLPLHQPTEGPLEMENNPIYSAASAPYE